MISKKERLPVRHVKPGVFRIASLNLLLLAAATLLLTGGAFTTTALAEAVWSWGNNSLGQLGDSTTSETSFPVQSGEGTIWATVSSRNVHTVSLRIDGTLWAWGQNSYGQLGNGTKDMSSFPIQVGTDSDWAAASAGGQHTVALKTDGRLWAWGRNDFGELGNNTKKDSLSPIQIGTGTDWITISAGGWHTMAIKADGTLWAWGHNYYGELGNNTNTNTDEPTQISTDPEGEPDSNWQTVSAGFLHTVALKTDGTLWAWGNNFYGQLGNNTQAISYSPLPVKTDQDSESEPDTDWHAVSAGYLHTVALKTDGTLWAWGDNEYGQLGDGTTTLSLVPVQIGNETDWEAISAGGRHTLAIKTDGSLWAWGQNVFGQLGDGSNNDRHQPGQIGVGADWTAVEAGFSYSVTLTPGPDSTAVQILGVTSSLKSNPLPGEIFRFAAGAVSPEAETNEYRFLYRAGYGTPAWDSNRWQVIQDWSPVSWVDTSFSESGNYYVVAQSIAQGAPWKEGDPQGGFNVNLSGTLQITTATSNLIANPQPGEMFRVTIDTVGLEGGIPTYRFYYKAGYGTPAWHANQWQIIQDWSSTNWVETSFDAPGNYYIVGQVINAGETWADGDPQGGFNVVVE